MSAAPTTADGPETRLRHAFRSGEGEYGRLPLPFEIFARRVQEIAERRVSGSGPGAAPERIAQVIERMAGADLFLATACDQGVTGAWEVFIARFLPRLRGLARRQGASEDAADEIVGNLPGDLTLPPAGGGARTRIGTYEGTGNLFGWLAVIVLRRLADRARGPRVASLEGDAESGETGPVARSSPDGGGPEGRALAAETVQQLEAAFPEAWKGLTPQQSLVLLYKFHDGLAQREIARLLGVGESRVSHILRAAVERLRDGLRKALPASGWPDGDGFWTEIAPVVRDCLSSPAPASVLRVSKDPGDR